MLPTPEQRAFAMSRGFGIFTSAKTIIEAHAAHLRILAKIAARKAAK